MDQNLLLEILKSDLGRDTKEKILSYWLLPHGELSTTTPIQTTEGRAGSVRRPTKESLDLKKNPRLAEEQKAMEESLGEVGGDDE